MIIVEKHLVRSGTEVMASQVVTKDRRDEIVEIDWPEWVWVGLRSYGWTVEVSVVESSLDAYRITPTTPNWAGICRELAVALAGIVTATEQALAEAGRQPPQEVEGEAFPAEGSSTPTAIERLQSEMNEARAASDHFRTARMEAEMIEHEHDRDTAEGVCRICAAAATGSDS